MVTALRGAYHRDRDVRQEDESRANRDAGRVDRRSGARVAPERFRIGAAGRSDGEQVPRRPTAWRAVLVGAGLGAWLGMLTGLVPGLLLPTMALLPMLLGGLLAGVVAGAVLGVIVYWATDRRDVAGSTGRRSLGPRSRSVAPQRWKPPRRVTGARLRMGGRPRELHRTVLPGLGLSYAMDTAEGRRVGVVAHVSGRRDLISYDPQDPDRVQHTVVLTESEARAVAQLLGLPVFVDQVNDLAGGLDGVRAVRIPIAAGSPYSGRQLADIRARTRTGASIVAVIRDGRANPSPRPDFTFRPGDAVVVVGDDKATAAMRDVLIHG